MLTETEKEADMQASIAFKELAEEPTTANCPAYLEYCRSEAERLGDTQ